MPKLKSVTTLVEPTVGLTAGDTYFVGSGKSGTSWSAFVDNVLATYAPLLGGWLSGIVDPNDIYVVEDEPSAGGNQAMMYLGAGVFAPLGVKPPAPNTWYAASWGDDAAEGDDPNNPTLTIGQAITNAQSAGPTSANHASVVVLDAESYSENITVPDYVHVHMPVGTLNGNLELGDESCFDGNVHEGSVDRISGAIATAVYRVLLHRYDGTITNTVSGSTLVIDVGEIELGADSVVGVPLSTSGARIVGRVGSIRDIGFASTIGVQVTNGELDLMVGTIDTDTTIDVSGGEARMMCSSLSGPPTHSGGVLQITRPGQTVISKAQYVNTDTSTNINASASVEIPLLGTQRFLDSDFSVAAGPSTTRLVCNFDGQIRVSGGISMATASGTITCSAVALGVNGTPTTRPGAQGLVSTTVSPIGLASLSPMYLDVSNGDEISLFSARLNSSTATVVQVSGASGILIERVA